jgi:succinate-semialdehyde dehydrogenase/glutarate-semialdehyde dehydrogenase
VQDAVNHGAKVHTGGARIGNTGFFWQPTVLTDVPDDARIMYQEPFGAVVAIRPFSKFDEVVAMANRLPYGLAAYAFTRNGAEATAIGRAIEAGMVGVNTFGITVPETPFGGVKESGYGSEGGIEGFEPYLTTKYISQM